MKALAEQRIEPSARSWERSELARFAATSWRLRTPLAVYLVLVAGAAVSYERLAPRVYEAKFRARVARVSVVGNTMLAPLSFPGATHVAGSTWLVEDPEVVGAYISGPARPTGVVGDTGAELEFEWIPKLDPRGNLLAAEGIFDLAVRGGDREALTGVLDRAWTAIEERQRGAFGELEKAAALHRRSLDRLRDESLATIAEMEKEWLAREGAAGEDPDRRYALAFELARARVEADIRRAEAEYTLHYHPPELLQPPAAAAEPIRPNSRLVYALAAAAGLAGTVALVSVAGAWREVRGPSPSGG